MNAVLQKLLDDMKPGRRGIHGTANAYSSANEYEPQLAAWWECSFDWLKLVVAGDSGVNTVRMLRDKHTGIIPIVRPYNTSCPSNVIDPTFVHWYMDAAGGPVIIESPFNEFYYDHENAWARAFDATEDEYDLGPFGLPLLGGTQPGEIKHADLSKLTMAYAAPLTTMSSISSMPADWPAQVARGWSQFARIVLDAGSIPTTPSIETWRFDSIFVPLFTVLCRDYADLLKRSILACHPRTLNHPIDYVKDTGGWLGWRAMDDFVLGRLGEHMQIGAPESGPECGWNQDSNYPQVTAEIHRDMVKAQLEYKVPAYYLFDCMWLWEASGGFADASWHNNQRWGGGKDLPAVELLKTWRGDTPATELTDDIILAIGLRHPYLINADMGLALYRAGKEAGFGDAMTDEFPELGWTFQRFQGGVVAAPTGQWDKVRAVKAP